MGEVLKKYSDKRSLLVGQCRFPPQLTSLVRQVEHPLHLFVQGVLGHVGDPDLTLEVGDGGGGEGDRGGGEGQQ